MGLELARRTERIAEKLAKLARTPPSDTLRDFRGHRQRRGRRSAIHELNWVQRMEGSHVSARAWHLFFQAALGTAVFVPIGIAGLLTVQGGLGGISGVFLLSVACLAAAPLAIEGDPVFLEREGGGRLSRYWWFRGLAILMVLEGAAFLASLAWNTIRHPDPDEFLHVSTLLPAFFGLIGLVTLALLSFSALCVAAADKRPKLGR